MTDPAVPSASLDSAAESELHAAKRAKLHALEAAGLQAFPHSFPRTHLAGALQESYAELPSGTETEDKVAVAGRIRSVRNSGMFIDLHDASGKIQVFCHKDNMSEDELAKLKFFDLGDTIGVEGMVRRTPRGELSVNARRVEMLAKSLQPLPEKYHGLADIEQRYRQRYVDLIVNEESRDTLRARSRIVSFVRRYLEGIGGMEVETPILHPILGGASAKPFMTHHNALDATFYMRVAPELYLKRLLVGQFSDVVFEIGRCFRNEGISVRHNPEFSLLESYHAYKDYRDIMDLVEDMVSKLVVHLTGSTKVMFGETEIDFATPWRRASMLDLVKEATGVDFLMFEDAVSARLKARELGVDTPPIANWGQVVEAVFEHKVEKSLIQPTHVTDTPLDISPLAKTHRDNPRLVERFETFVNTWEIANAFTELNDPRIQLARFESQVAQREAGDEEAQMLDSDYVTALEYGLMPCAGWGMGIDRLTMLMTGSHNIRDVICFPTLKPKLHG